MLIEAVSRVKEIRTKDSTKHLQLLIDNLKSQQKTHKVAIKISEGYVFVPMQDIMYCRSDMGNTELYYVTAKKHVTSIALKDMHKKLSSDLFFRIHNSFIVNRNFKISFKKEILMSFKCKMERISL